MSLNIPEQFQQPSSAFFTNSTITVNHHSMSSSLSQSSQLTFRWKRKYGNIQSLYLNNWHQYSCSPLDWNATIQVEVENNGTLVNKSTFGPILLEKMLKSQLKPDRYRVWLGINNSSPFEADIVVKGSSQILFSITIGSQTLEIDHGIMMKRGWYAFSCLADSGILMVNAQFFKQKWNIFLSKLKIESKRSNAESKETLSIVFQNKHERDIFLVRLIELSQKIKNNQKSKVRITASQSTNHQQIIRSTEQMNIKQTFGGQKRNFQQLDRSLVEILDPQGLGNRTMQDIYDLLYNPDETPVNTPKNNPLQNPQTFIDQEPLDLSKQFEAQEKLYSPSITGNKNPHSNYHKKSTSYDKILKLQEVTIPFKSPQIYQTPHHNWKQDSRISTFLQHPHKIVELLETVNQLEMDNYKLNLQVDHYRRKAEMRNLHHHKDQQIQVLKSMIEKMAVRMNFIENKVSSEMLRPISQPYEYGLTGNDKHVPQFLKKNLPFTKSQVGAKKYLKSGLASNRHKGQNNTVFDMNETIKGPCDNRKDNRSPSDRPRYSYQKQYYTHKHKRSPDFGQRSSHKQTI